LGLLRLRSPIDSHNHFHYSGDKIQRATTGGAFNARLGNQCSRTEENRSKQQILSASIKQLEEGLS
jgi:hypothetical protein